ncbi:hypothetical protein PoB_005830900 [Plakobranchus ocellatus]|uniref:Uncharacterized protein n=1 Tax=Plakobranchus ocellatus TaxID=259542 RepID=A0AAV4CGD5_9GAST|nr:hypothetical protein PoB_005830900 [Plakobranchus ocellatus]
MVSALDFILVFGSFVQMVPAIDFSLAVYSLVQMVSALDFILVFDSLVQMVPALDFILVFGSLLQLFPALDFVLVFDSLVQLLPSYRLRPCFPWQERRNGWRRKYPETVVLFVMILKMLKMLHHFCIKTDLSCLWFRTVSFLQKKYLSITDLLIENII